MRSRIAVVGFVVVAIALTGCASAPIPPTYTQDALKAICERRGGWWRPTILDGDCESNSQV